MEDENINQTTPKRVRTHIRHRTKTQKMAERAQREIKDQKMESADNKWRKFQKGSNSNQSRIFGVSQERAKRPQGKIVAKIKMLTNGGNQRAEKSGTLKLWGGSFAPRCTRGASKVARDICKKSKHASRSELQLCPSSGQSLGAKSKKSSKFPE